MSTPLTCAFCNAPAALAYPGNDAKNGGERPVCINGHSPCACCGGQTDRRMDFCTSCEALATREQDTWWPITVDGEGTYCHHTCQRCGAGVSHYLSPAECHEPPTVPGTPDQNDAKNFHPDCRPFLAPGDRLQVSVTFSLPSSADSGTLWSALEALRGARDGDFPAGVVLESAVITTTGYDITGGMVKDINSEAEKRHATS